MRLNENGIKDLCEQAFKYSIYTHSILKPTPETIDMTVPFSTYFPIEIHEKIEPGHEQLGRLMMAMSQYIEWTNVYFNEYLNGKELKIDTHYPELFESFSCAKMFVDTSCRELLSILKENGFL